MPSKKMPSNHWSGPMTSAGTPNFAGDDMRAIFATPPMTGSPAAAVVAVPPAVVTVPPAVVAVPPAVVVVVLPPQPATATSAITRTASSATHITFRIASLLWFCPSPLDRPWPRGFHIKSILA